jgi:ABC-type nitrate/sulfonate/bicarbonate transport system substrate-binding protein
LSLLALFVLIAALALAACDGDDDDTASNTSGTSTTAATIGVSGTAGASGDSASLEPKSLTFMAGFKPQANLPFVGAYVAQEKGFFDELNLKVDIRHAQSGEHLQLLLAGEVQVTTANAAQVVERAADGLPLVSIALIGQKSEQGFAVGANSGIDTVQDWAGKTLGYKGTVPIEFLATAAANGLNPDDVKQVKVGFDPRVLSEGQVDILSVFISNEPGQLARIGYPVKVFDPSDYGLPMLGLTYIASQDGIQKDPEAIRRFVQAAIKGIQYAADHPDEALDIVMKYAPQENRDQQKFMLTTELARARTELTEQNGYGWQTPEQWQALADSLTQYEVIKPGADVSKMFTTQFLKPE